MADAPMVKLVGELIDRMVEPLGLAGWTIKREVQPGDDTASCAAMPEYRVATLVVDPDKLDTQDELDEIVCHELSHCLTWPLASVADDLAIALSESASPAMRGPLAKLLKEQVRVAEERTTTDVGRALVGLLRQVWAMEKELATVKAELRAAKKAA